MKGFVKYGKFVPHKVSFTSEKQKEDIALQLKIRGVPYEVVSTENKGLYERLTAQKADLSYSKFKEILSKENRIN